MSVRVSTRSGAAKKVRLASGSSPSPSESNISAIAAMEREATAGRTAGERMGDLIARQAGRLWFVIFHAVWFVGWVILNARLIPGVKAIDPFPYPFLTFVVSLEAIFLSLFILMSQNRGGRQADARAHLDLQINLLAEQESTKILQMLQEICEHHHLSIANDPEVELLKAPTEPGALLKELKDSLPEEC